MRVKSHYEPELRSLGSIVESDSTIDGHVHATARSLSERSCVERSTFARDFDRS